MNDAEAAARAIVDILATGDLDAVSSAVAEDYIDHQGLGDVEIRRVARIPPGCGGRPHRREG